MLEGDWVRWVSVEEELRDVVGNPDYWVLILFGLSGANAAYTVEHQHYEPGTEANDEFELIICPVMPPIAIVYCRSSRMNAAQLAAILQSSTEGGMVTHHQPIDSLAPGKLVLFGDDDIVPSQMDTVREILRPLQEE